jgi:2-C-methyl-D-erythritol 2,4-cyclodiphosphate synthase
LYRIGFGYDAHRLVKGRPLILGGVTIPFDLGLDGHSDADVLVHAVIDAIIGGLGLGDIGTHFPDTDEQYRGASSVSLLAVVFSWVKREGLSINNLDATIVAQRPMLRSYIPQMRKTLAGILDTGEERVNIKGKTTEGMGFCGRQEGMAAYAVVSLGQKAP